MRLNPRPNLFFKNEYIPKFPFDDDYRFEHDWVDEKPKFVHDYMFFSKQKSYCGIICVRCGKTKTFFWRRR